MSVLLCLTFCDHKMKAHHASHGICGYKLKITDLPHKWISLNRLESNPCLSPWFQYLRYFIIKFKITCLPASWLSFTFSDADLFFSDTDLASFACLQEKLSMSTLLSLKELSASRILYNVLYCNSRLFLLLLCKECSNNRCLVFFCMSVNKYLDRKSW